MNAHLITGEEHVELFNHFIDRLESIRLVDHLDNRSLSFVRLQRIT